MAQHMPWVRLWALKCAEVTLYEVKVIGIYNQELGDEFLMDPELPGEFYIDSAERTTDGRWAKVVTLTDPDTAFALKMRFG
jgi:hypothetical protein